MADDTIAREDIIRMAAECGFPVNWQHPDVREIKFKRFVDFANLVAAAEREACARIAETKYDKGITASGSPKQGWNWACENIGKAIRARGEK